MKKTLNINLAGYPFIIDEDAYNLLKDYLDTIRYAFETSEDTGELATDIEGRIAEILIEKENGMTRIVTLEEISKVIERIGKPSEFIEVNETIVSDAYKKANNDYEEIKEEILSPPPYEPKWISKNPFARKKLFRDPQGAMIGGVCAGFAQYIHIDVTIIRLLTILLFFLSASTVAIVYIILWIVVPEARTPLQRMQMQGEDPTVENIGKTVTDNYSDGSNQDISSKSGLSKVFSILMKCLIILGLTIAIPLLIALGVGLLGCIIAAFVIGLQIVANNAEGSFFDSVLEGQLVFYILLAVIGGTITLGIPLWLFVRSFLGKKVSHTTPTNRRIMLIIWLGGIALLSVFTVKAVRKTHQINHQEWGINREMMKQLEKIESEDIANIRIENGGIIIESKDGKRVEIANGRVSIEKSGSESEKESFEINQSISDSLSVETMTIPNDTIK